MDIRALLCITLLSAVSDGRAIGATETAGIAHREATDELAFVLLADSVAELAVHRYDVALAFVGGHLSIDFIESVNVTDLLVLANTTMERDIADEKARTVCTLLRESIDEDELVNVLTQHDEWRSRLYRERLDLFVSSLPEHLVSPFGSWLSESRADITVPDREYEAWWRELGDDNHRDWLGNTCQRTWITY